jgi:hypothetical protein
VLRAGPLEEVAAAARLPAGRAKLALAGAAPKLSAALLASCVDGGSGDGCTISMVRRCNFNQ